MNNNKRKPPTFQHLPQVRAKKLKKEWVAKQKIKSRWKAQKRRDGIVTQRDVLSRPETLSDSQQTGEPTVAHEERGVLTNKVESDENDDEGQHSSDDEPVLTAPVQKNKEKTRTQRQDVPGSGPSLRELQKQAYSPASLHHYKSRPLHRSKSHTSAEGSGSSRKERVNRNRGGGQPDMRLRMSAMLEKIKRDYS
ncbi:hypothetical protein BJV78DRAFT_1117456 [Lactifluus subvellereus]|nr:hypothetical protein BJV78DRAFT_1117456 [Lactifluus subvellereus]